MAGAAAPQEKSSLAPSLRAMLLPLALAQFIASYDSSSMNVALSDIAADLNTTVTGVQTAMTFFTLIMAAGMITGSRLTDVWGRKICFQGGIALYGLGAFLTAVAPALGVMILGWSVFEGIGSALMIPPIYILVTVSFDDLTQRARAFGVISAMAGMGAALGPLIGGFFATAISWRASFGAEVLVCITILYLSRRIADVRPTGPRKPFDIPGAVLSAGGLIFVVIGVLQSRDYGWFTARKDFVIGDTTVLEAGSISPIWLFIGLGLALLAFFALYEIYRERRGQDLLVPMRLFANRMSNLGLVTQNIQWFMMIGSSFVISVFLQVSQGYNAIQTGLVFTPSTAGLLLSSVVAGRLARRFSQRALIISGFVLAEAGVALLFLLVDANSSALSFVPGLFSFGIGAGIMVTASVNVVQSSVPEADQGALSGVSRSVSNLGSSLGTAVAGSVLVAGIIFGVTALTDESTVLSPSQKDRISVALEGDISALSDEQVEAALEGQPQDVVDEVVRINAKARNDALGLALAAIGIAGLLGLGAALFIPGRRAQRTGPAQGVV
jgi:MFS family permease